MSRSILSIYQFHWPIKFCVCGLGSFLVLYATVGNWFIPVHKWSISLSPQSNITADVGMTGFQYSPLAMPPIHIQVVLRKVRRLLFLWASQAVSGALSSWSAWSHQSWLCQVQERSWVLTNSLDGHGDPGIYHPFLSPKIFTLWQINIDPGSHRGWKTSFH